MKLKLILLALFYLGFQVSSWAQCAMCRASVENNVANGETSIGAGLNTGIIYLFTMPYLLAAVIWFLWYRASKKRKEKLALR